MQVSLAGLGNMGLPIAERILAAGHELTVWNRTPGKAGELTAQGAAEAPAPDRLLAEAPLCVTMLSDDAALEAVVSGPGGVLAGARAGSILVDMSTVSVAASARVAEAAGAAGVRYLRAPVSGNPTVVRAGNLTIVVSGPADAFAEARPLLEAIGPTIYHVGEGEEARVVKLALQVVIGGTAELLAEALVLGEAGNVERATLLEVLANSAVGSPFVRYKTGPLLADDYSATFTTAMMLKDLDLVLAAAADAGVALPLTRALRPRLLETIDAGYAGADFMAVFPALKTRPAG